MAKTCLGRTGLNHQCNSRKCLLRTSGRQLCSLPYHQCCFFTVFLSNGKRKHAASAVCGHHFVFWVELVLAWSWWWGQQSSEIKASQVPDDIVEPEHLPTLLSYWISCIVRWYISTLGKPVWLRCLPLERKLKFYLIHTVFFSFFKFLLTFSWMIMLC